jgi:DNA-directed RNA polymerase specialized sigma24 family protein
VKNVDINAVLEKNDTYILALANKKVFHNEMYADALQLERDELAQRVRIKLWHVLEKKQITSYKMYIRQIVQHEFIDMIRQNKGMLPLPLDQEGEFIPGSVLKTIFPSDKDRDDPSLEVEQKETTAECLSLVAHHIAALPSHQRRLMICILKEEVGDGRQLMKAFKAHNVSIETFFWPTEKKGLHNLKSSLSPARKKLGVLREKLLAYPDIYYKR